MFEESKSCSHNHNEWIGTYKSGRVENGGELDEKMSKDENLSSKEAFVLVAP